ncbi:MAG: hypothetical protein ABWY36_01550 [Leifsonia sp.]
MVVEKLECLHELRAVASARMGVDRLDQGIPRGRRTSMIDEMVAGRDEFWHRQRIGEIAPGADGGGESADPSYAHIEVPDRQTSPPHATAADRAMLSADADLDGMSRVQQARRQRHAVQFRRRCPAEERVPWQHLRQGGARIEHRGRERGGHPHSMVGADEVLRPQPFGRDTGLLGARGTEPAAGELIGEGRSAVHADSLPRQRTLRCESRPRRGISGDESGL